jgi:hypothetical protein
MDTNKAKAVNSLMAWLDNSRRLIRVEADHHPLNATWRHDALMMGSALHFINEGDLWFAREVLKTYQANPPATYTDEGKANFYKNMQWCIDLLEYPDIEFAGFDKPIRKI